MMKETSKKYSILQFPQMQNLYSSHLYYDMIVFIDLEWIFIKFLLILFRKWETTTVVHHKNKQKNHSESSQLKLLLVVKVHRKLFRGKIYFLNSSITFYQPWHIYKKTEVVFSSIFLASMSPWNRKSEKVLIPMST